jgi:hypothetical protein
MSDLLLKIMKGLFFIGRKQSRRNLSYRDESLSEKTIVIFVRTIVILAVVVGYNMGVKDTNADYSNALLIRTLKAVIATLSSDDETNDQSPLKLIER